METYNYETAVQYLLQIPKFAKKTTRENLLGLLEKLGNPHRYAKAIHVAGTNGKGSTCAYLDQILRCAGYETALFTSPHLVDLEERFRVNGAIVQRSEFVECFIQFKVAMDQYVAEGKVHVSFFEAIFVIATLIFRRHQLDYIIYETGMGGRLDATNVLEPILTVITSVGRDHMQYLGDTIEEIAKEKAGIMKRGVPVVYLAENDGAVVFREESIEKGAKAFPISKETIKIQKKNHKYIDFCMENGYSKYGSLRISTCAEYQVENALLAIGSAKILLPDLDIAPIKEGLLQMKWQCRMEEVEKDVYIDGAHNEPAIRRLLETVKTLDYAENGLLFAVVKDKDYEKMIQMIVDADLFSNIFVTVVQGERASTAEEIVRCFQKMGYPNVLAYEEAKQTFSKAMEWKKGANGRALFCAGSLYLAGELQKQMKGTR